MIRYIKQKNNYSCGAVTIFNSLKWAGKKIALKKDFERLLKNCGITKELAITSQLLFESVLEIESKNFFNIQKEYNPNFLIIKNHLNNPHSAVIIKFLSSKKDFDGHFAFIDKYENNKFRIINFEEEALISFVSEYEIKKILQSKRNSTEELMHHYPHIWLLTKEIKNEN